MELNNHESASSLFLSAGHGFAIVESPQSDFRSEPVCFDVPMIGPLQAGQERPMVSIREMLPSDMYDLEESGSVRRGFDPAEPMSDEQWHALAQWANADDSEGIADALRNELNEARKAYYGPRSWWRKKGRHQKGSSRAGALQWAMETAQKARARMERIQGALDALYSYDRHGAYDVARDSGVGRVADGSDEIASDGSIAARDPQGEALQAAPAVAQSLARRYGRDESTERFCNLMDYLAEMLDQWNTASIEDRTELSEKAGRLQAGVVKRYRASVARVLSARETWGNGDAPWHWLYLTRAQLEQVCEACSAVAESARVEESAAF